MIGVKSKYQLRTGVLRARITSSIARIHRDRRHSRRRADRFLRAAEANIDALAVNIERDAGQRCHGVHDQQRAQLIGHFAKIVEALHDGPSKSRHAPGRRI